VDNAHRAAAVRATVRRVDDLDVPNCGCLHRMEEFEGSDGTFFWFCGHCGASKDA